MHLPHVRRRPAIVLRTSSFRLALFAAAFLSSSGHASDLRLTIAGEPHIVYDWARDRCDETDIPDSGMRAFRDNEGLIRLFSTWSVNRALVGKTFDTLRRDCLVSYRGAENDDPAAFNDRGWLASTYTTDGRVVYAIIHNEFLGYKRRSSLCPSGIYTNCWYNSLGLAKSQDGGRSFARVGLVAAPLERYVPDMGQRVGPSTPTNIVQLDGWYYFIFVFDFIPKQRQVCIARTNNLSDPSSWRAWDGSDFQIEFSNPYNGAKREPCKHLIGLPVATPTSLVVHQKSGTFVLIQIRPTGFYYSTSMDMLHWSKANILMPASTYRPKCDEQATYTWPGLIDPQSQSRNFETIGDSAFLLYVRKPVVNCKTSWNRNIMRVPVYVVQ